HAGHDQIAPLLGRIAMARRARVPARVMQLVADARHLQPADHLAVGGALRIRVDGRQVVGLLDAGAHIERDRVEELLARRLDRLGRRGVSRAAAMRFPVAVSHVASLTDRFSGLQDYSSNEILRSRASAFQRVMSVWMNWPN